MERLCLMQAHSKGLLFLEQLFRFLSSQPRLFTCSREHKRWYRCLYTYTNPVSGPQQRGRYATPRTQRDSKEKSRQFSFCFRKQLVKPQLWGELRSPATTPHFVVLVSNKGLKGKFVRGPRLLRSQSAFKKQ